MFVFVHLHKCAGTSVVDAAQAAGLRLPKEHANANPFDGETMVDYFSRMTLARFRRFMKGMTEEGVEFFAMEWDMPQLPVVETAHKEFGVKFFTILRDPLERAVSNMRMDAAFGWGKPFKNLDAYLDGSATYRSTNYYTKFLSGNAYKPRASISDLSGALSVMGTIIKYSFVGEDLLTFLTRDVGLPITTLPVANAAQNTKEIARYTGPLRADPTPAEYANFHRRNAIDYALYDILRNRRRN